MKAIILGVAGQDGQYLAELLLSKGYQTIGVARRSSQPRNYLIPLLHKGLELIEGDVTDAHCMNSIISKYKPDLLFNLAAMSHVHTSFSSPSSTFEINTISIINILEAIRTLSPTTRLYQASTSEMFGKNFTEKNGEKYQDEDTALLPQSPYGISKLAAHQAVRLYRESYGLFACAGILFNHESERRGENFVTRKITKYVGQLAVAMQKEPFYPAVGHPIEDFPKLKLGNLNAYRDWSHAEDMVTAMVMMLEADKPNDYVVGSGETYSVEQFVDAAFKEIGLNWKDYVEIDQALIRPAEVDYLRANPEKIKRELGWQPKLDFEGLVKRMVKYDTERAALKSSLYERV